jgi:Tfp pilus assembly protein PilN
METMKIREAAGKASSVFSTWSARAGRLGTALWKGLSFNPVEAYLVPREGLVVSIQEDGFSVLTGRKVSSRIRISGGRRYGKEGGKSPDPERVAAAADAAIRETRRPPREVCLCIPRAWVLYRTADFPVVVRENLTGAVSFELDRLTPLPADKSLYDFRVLKESEDRVEIALMAVRADRINPYLQALQERGMTVTRVMADTTGWATLAAFTGTNNWAVLVSIANGRFEVGRLKDGMIQHSVAGTFRSVSVAGKIWELLPEIESRVEEIRQEGGAPHLVVGTSDDGYQGLLNHLQIPVTFLREAELKIQFPTGEKSLPFDAVGSLLASLLPDRAAMNLLDRGAPKKEAAPLVLTAVLAACLTALGIVMLLTPLQVENRRIDEVDRQIAATRDEVRRVDNLRKEADALVEEVTTIQKFKTKKMIALDILRELTAVLPKGAWLTRVRVTENTVDIEGYASAATELLPLLEASPYFIKVEFAAPTFRDTRSNAERFVIKMELEDYRPPRKESDDGKKA